VKDRMGLNTLPASYALDITATASWSAMRPIPIMVPCSGQQWLLRLGMIPSVLIYGHVADTDLFGVEGITPVSKWVNDHIFF